MRLIKLNITKADLRSIDDTIPARIEIDTIDNECRIETDDISLRDQLKQRGFRE